MRFIFGRHLAVYDIAGNVGDVVYFDDFVVGDATTAAGSGSGGRPRRR